MARGRIHPYAPREAHTRAIAECVRAYIDELAREGLHPTLRNVYYHVSGLGLIEKSQEAYRRLADQTANMRKGGYIALESLSDGSRHRVEWQLHERPSDALLEAAEHYSSDPWVEQPEAVELWCEGDTHRDFLTPVAWEFRVPLFPTHGVASLATLLESIVAIERRWKERGQPTVILYVGDHDGPGLLMSSTLHERLVELHMPPEACRVVRIALTYEQIRDHKPPLPSRPLKKRDPSKKPDPAAEWYEAQFPGLGAIELDAVPPTEVVDIVRAGLWEHIGDKEAWERHRKRDERVRRHLITFVKEHADDLDRAVLGDDEEEDTDEQED